MKLSTPESSKCEAYGDEYPVEKPMSIGERVFLVAVIVVALVVCVLCFGRGA